MTQAGDEYQQAPSQQSEGNILLGAINRILNETIRYKSIEDVARLCLEVSLELTGSKFGFIGEVNDAGRFDTIVMSDPGWAACRIAETDAVRLIEDMEISGLWGEVILTGRPLLTNSPSRHPASVGLPQGHPELTSFLGVPLKREGRTFGAVSLANKAGGYDPADQEKIEALSTAFAEAFIRLRKDEELRAGRERCRLLFDRMTNGFALLEVLPGESGEPYDYRFLDVNPAFEELLGRRRAEIVGGTVREAFPETREHWLEACSKVAVTAESVHFELPPERMGKRLDILAFCPKRGQIATFLADITERKAAEENLNRLNIELEDTVAARTLELRQANEQLKKEIASREETELALRESERLYRTSARNLPGGMLQIIDREFRIKFIEGEELEKIGLAPDDIAGKRISEITSRATAEYMESHLRQVLEGRHVTFEAEIAGRSFLVNAVPLPGPTGDVNHILTLSVNITDLKNAREKLIRSEATARALLNAIPESAFLMTPDGMIIDTNETTAKKLGKSVKEMTGGNAFSMVTDEVARSRMNKIEAILRKPALTVFVDRCNERWIKNIINPILDPEGSVDRIAIIGFDITDQYESEQKLRRLTNELKKQKRRLEVAVRDLKTSNEELEAFSHSVSHDLRTPLLSIAGYKDMLLETGAVSADEEAKRYLLRISDTIAGMEQLIHDLLTFSRTTRGDIEIEEIDLSLLARSAIEQLRAMDPDREVEVLVEEKLTARGDFQLLSALLANLLGNAWKFTRKTARARIEMGVLDDGRRRVFFVRDNGSGFDQAHAGKLFVPFSRLHDQSEFEGTGIGLATVQRIVHRHGGETWAEGRPGEGATFYFTLP